MLYEAYFIRPTYIYIGLICMISMFLLSRLSYTTSVLRLVCLIYIRPLTLQVGIASNPFIPSLLRMLLRVYQRVSSDPL
jgi:hypothetical protein